MVSASLQGFDNTFWDSVTAEKLYSDLALLPKAPLPSIAHLRKRLLLTDAPANDNIHYSRMAGLLEIGDAEHVWALLRPIAQDSEDFFKLARNSAFLIEEDQAICEIWKDHKHLDTSVTTRSICLAKLGHWSQAVTTLMLHDTLGELSDIDRTLIAGYLDPELVTEENGIQIAPQDVTPSRFLLAQSIGHPLTVQELPLTYAVTSLSASAGWKARLDAAERLFKAGSLTSNQLLGIYTEKKAAASGGVWERVRAVRKLRRALKTDSVTPDHLERLFAVMNDSGLAKAAASKFAPSLHDMDTLSKTDPAIIQLGLLAGFGHIKLVRAGTDIRLRLWRTDVTLGERTSRQAIANALSKKVKYTPPTASKVLQALSLGTRIKEGDILALQKAIVLLREMGLEDDAQTIAIEFLILVDQSA